VPGPRINTKLDSIPRGLESPDLYRHTGYTTPTLEKLSNDQDCLRSKNIPKLGNAMPAQFCRPITSLFVRPYDKLPLYLGDGAL
jgi:hypothetical protein